MKFYHKNEEIINLEENKIEMNKIEFEISNKCQKIDEAIYDKLYTIEVHNNDRMDGKYSSTSKRMSREKRSKALSTRYNLTKNPN